MIDAVRQGPYSEFSKLKKIGFFKLKVWIQKSTHF